MPTIDNLASTTVLEDTDTIPLYSVSERDTRKVTLPILADYVQTAIEGEPDETIYALTVSGSTFTVTVLPTVAGGSVWAQLSPSSAATAATIILPGVADRVLGQEVRVTCTQSVAALAINGNGATVLGGPTTLAANGFFTLSYDNISNIWYRVA